VIRVRRCKATAFYDILGLEEVKSSCSDGEIKKAYRKLSLLTHPDKNGYEGADEAFKMVSRAFQILSDSDKKAQYDRFGHDPDNRFASASAAQGASPFSGFARSPGAGGAGRGPMFEEELTPEELFRQFFGGGAFGGGPMGFGGGGFGGPGFVFNLGGGPGIRVHQFGGGRPRARPGTAQGAQREDPQSLLSIITSLLPLLILFVIPALNALFSGSSTPSGPSVRFDTPASPYTKAHTSSTLGVKYFVNPAEVSEYGSRQWSQLDRMAEQRYMHHLNVQCEREQQVRSNMVQEASGWFFQDVDKMERARKMPMARCQELNKLTRKQQGSFGW